MGAELLPHGLDKPRTVRVKSTQDDGDGNSYKMPLLLMSDAVRRDSSQTSELLDKNLVFAALELLALSLQFYLIIQWRTFQSSASSRTDLKWQPHLPIAFKERMV